MTELELARLTANASKLILDEFADKKDAGGHDYLQHLYAVAEGVDKKGEIAGSEYNPDIRVFYRRAYIVALLHDILEDTDCSEQELRNAGCDDDIIEAIKSVTRRKDEQYYFDFIKRANKNPMGRIVKICDLENNMDIKRLKKFEDYEMKRLKKYWYSWKYLKGEITEKEVEKEINSYK